MRTTFVTGAPGWLGNRLVRGLVTGLEDLPELPRTQRVRCLVLPGFDVGELRALPNIECINGDITRPETLRGRMDGCDTVIHAAGLIHPKRIQELYAVNTNGVRNVLEEAMRVGVHRFVFVSSNSPAGTNPSRDALFTEDMPFNPYKHYGRSKMHAEQIVNEAHRSGRIEAVIIRPCWFYGPGQPPRQSEFFKMIKAGRPPLFGDGENLRSMSYIDHVVQGLILAATVPRAAGQTYWIADERPYTTREIYETVARLLGVRELAYLKIPNVACTLFEGADTLLQALGRYHTKVHVAGEMNKDIACSIEKAKRELGFRPVVDLREGMRRSIAWCRERGMEI
jgi:nucleoside-diphosphate-sugar epimerase